MRRTGLRLRITVLVVLYMLLLSLAVVYHGNVVNERAEDLVWSSLLESELDHYLQRRAEDPGYRWRDIEGASTFYSTVFGPEVVEMDTGEDDFAYRTLNVDGQEKAGLYDVTGVLPDEVPPHWSVYFGVDDIDGAVRSVEEQGGQVITPIADSPYGRWATVTDPMGADFVITSVKPAG